MALHLLTLSTILIRGTILCADPLEAKAQQRAWMAFGDIRGNFEPCGCDVSTDLGGILRIGSFVQKQRMLNPQIIVLSLGNSLSPTQHGREVDSLLEASFGELKLSAVMVNVLEWRQLQGEGLKGDLPYVLSNVKKSELIAHVKVSIDLPQAMVMAYLSPQQLSKDRSPSSSPLRVADASLLQKWRTIISAPQNKPKLKILLYAGPIEELNRIESSGIFDTIIASNPHPIDSQSHLPSGRLSDDQLLFSKKHAVYMVPLGGQGIVLDPYSSGHRAVPLGRALLNSPEPSAYTTAANPVPAPSRAASKILLSSRIQWLDAEWTAGSPLQKIEDQYVQRQSLLFRQHVEQKWKDQKNSDQPEFVGAESCQSCHNQDYKIWQQSSHAHALNTLEQKQRQENLSCIACHVVGFEHPKGYVDQERTSQLANVQCESCHGPRSEHIKDPSQSPKWDAAQQCQNCHQGEHSPQFIFEQYWPKIQHGKASAR